ncbi:rRNA maturation factor [Tateyamaria sp. ANG-S1]|nr:rRNA maturation factor [Tateyamaria sp. ANG-S1]
MDILIEDARWQEAGLDTLAHRTIAATLEDRGIPAASVSLLACDDARIAVLNADFRDKPMPTNVLSWPEEDLSPEDAGHPPDAPQPGPDGTISLGDIAIAYDTCAREAVDQGKPFEAHVTHLLVHGTLHLLGYDHIRDPDATRMEALEIEILGKLGLPDPY